VRESTELAVVLLDTAADGASEEHLLRALLGSTADRQLFDQPLVERLDELLPAGLTERAAVVEAAVDARGIRQAQGGGHARDAWMPVLTAPSSFEGSAIVHRTGSTLLRRIGNATDRVRFYAPYATAGGFDLLAPTLLRAAGRGVEIELCVPNDASGAPAPASIISSELRQAVTIREPRADVVWPHLKLVTFDRRAAYVGSANFTRRGLAGGNLELGVLVEGDAVEQLDALLDSVLS
jgi:phosphatidylserine/phosphatidylglycerophosphate/cardiolipin synthase-like enzyme